jgi:hypothetical protein
MYPDITFQQYIFMINMRDIGLLCFVIEIINKTSKQTSSKHKRSGHDAFLE